MKILTGLFGTPEEINGGERCPTYLFRWTILRTRWFKAYLHHFVGDDWSRDLHDHPKRFISVGLWGSYVEYRPVAISAPDGWIDRIIYRAPWIRSFPAEHIHRIETPSKNCWTLVIVLKTVREWGFWHRGVFVQWRDYVRGKDGIADTMKACD